MVSVKEWGRALRLPLAIAYLLLNVYSCEGEVVRLVELKRQKKAALDAEMEKLKLIARQRGYAVTITNRPGENIVVELVPMEDWLKYST